MQKLWTGIRSRVALGDVAMCLVVVAIAIGVTTTYISHERAVHYWDLAGYEVLTEDTLDTFLVSPREGLHRIFESLSWDYNIYFTLPLLPVILVAGDSRLVFVLSLALVYFVPVALAIGALTCRLVRTPSRALFWSTALLVLLMPTAWVPTLRGLPDVSASLVFVLALIVYAGDIHLKHVRHWLAIGFLCGTAFLLRRHYAYAVLAFFVAAGLHGMFSVLVGQSSPRAALAFAGRLAMTGLVGGLTICTFGWPLVVNLFASDYGSLHQSYMLSVAHSFQFFLRAYGWGISLLAIAGWVLAIGTRALAPPAGAIVLFSAVFVALWTTLVRQVDPQYALHILPFVAGGLSLLGWILVGRWRTVGSRTGAIALASIVVFNCVVGLGAIRSGDPVAPWLAEQRPPIRRNDIEEIRRLIDFLRATARPDDPLYVAASSRFLNDDVVRQAEREWYGRKNVRLNLPLVPHVDSNDMYPVEGVLDADYVVVEDPFVGQLAGGERVAKVIHDAFVERWEIASDFRELPSEFYLDGELRVRIFRRTRATSRDVALRFLSAVERYVAMKPGRQADWLSIDHGNSTITAGESGYRLGAPFQAQSAERSHAFVYLGDVPHSGMVRVASIASDSPCANTSLSFSTADPASGREDALAVVPLSAGPTQIELPFTATGRRYLVLGLVSGPGASNCVVTLDGVSVAGNR